jgi:nitroimidazol reductase NimA-like FMN-containing flavoprotein (pyridoxamine 5'-phosphate oxidase superfamily)
MFRKQRRPRQALTEEESIEILNRHGVGVLSLNGDEGYPYGVPISYYYDDGALYFHGGHRGHKADSIAANPKASLTVIDHSETYAEEYANNFCSVIAFGKIEVVDDPDEKLARLMAFTLKFVPENPERTEEVVAKDVRGVTVFKFTIEHLTGKVGKYTDRAQSAMKRG